MNPQPTANILLCQSTSSGTTFIFVGTTFYVLGKTSPETGTTSPVVLPCEKQLALFLEQPLHIKEQHHQSWSPVLKQLLAVG
uniref:Uncharacterized protein n=1 Tax=Meloidogyne enterolobii TaxID=390850 RepID=A0A6V7XMK1_MELEN|nr:unnamed protein product [Meloidogyne enterolobii]